MVNYQTYPRARLQLGRDGVVIGRMDDGVVVLFSNPPPLKEQYVYLTKYQERVSANTGKKYIKCFEYLTESQFTQLRKNSEINEVAKYLGISFDDVKKLIELKRLSPDAAATYLLKITNSQGVLYDSTNFMLLPSRKTIYIGNDTAEVDEGPFLPDNIISDKFTFVVLDDAYESFEAIEIAEKLRSRGYIAFSFNSGSGSLVDLVVVLPRGDLVDRIISIKNSRIPRYFRKRIYLEVLGLTDGEVVLNDQPV